VPWSKEAQETLFEVVKTGATWNEVGKALFLSHNINKTGK
jgi:hypothetical protein